MSVKIGWDEKTCIHAGECVKGLPQVFKVEDGKFVVDAAAAGAADGIKLASKEDLVPEGADRPVFNVAPIVLMAPAIEMADGYPIEEDTANSIESEKERNRLRELGSKHLPESGGLIIRTACSKRRHGRPWNGSMSSRPVDEADQDGWSASGRTLVRRHPGELARRCLPRRMRRGLPEGSSRLVSGGSPVESQASGWFRSACSSRGVVRPRDGPMSSRPRDEIDEDGWSASRRMRRGLPQGSGQLVSGGSPTEI